MEFFIINLQLKQEAIHNVSALNKISTLNNSRDAACRVCSVKKEPTKPIRFQRFLLDVPNYFQFCNSD